jgi:hypothetical protein
MIFFVKQKTKAIMQKVNELSDKKNRVVDYKNRHGLEESFYKQPEGCDKCLKDWIIADENFNLATKTIFGKLKSFIPGTMAYQFRSDYKKQYLELKEHLLVLDMAIHKATLKIKEHKSTQNTPSTTPKNSPVSSRAASRSTSIEDVVVYPGLFAEASKALQAEVQKKLVHNITDVDFETQWDNNILCL